MLYLQTVSFIMFNVSPKTVATNINDLCNKASAEQYHDARFSSSGDFYIKTLQQNQHQGYSG